MSDGELYSVGRMRMDCVKAGMNFIRSNDVNNYRHVEVENNRYFESLAEGCDALSDLKMKWDKLTVWKNERLREWEKAYHAADSMDRHDLIEQRKQLFWLYEMERFFVVENNYHYFRTYWDE